MQCYCNYLVIALLVLWEDRSGTCDHNWDQSQRNISLANTSNRRNITPFRFSFSEFSFEENISFHQLLPQWILYHSLLIKLLKSCYTAALVENFVALLQLACRLFSVLIICHFQKQVLIPSRSKVGYFDVPNQPLNN